MQRFTVRRVLPVFLLCFGVLTVTGEWLREAGVAPVSKVAAQDEGAAPAPAPPAPAAPAAGQAEAPKPKKSMLRWFYDALGIRYVLAFLILSFAFVALLVMVLLSGRRDVICPAKLVEAFEAQVNEKQAQAAYELAAADESILGKVLAAGVEKIPGGLDAAMKAMQETGEDENMKIEHRLSYLALIGTIAPMVGLLGTVDGMVASFTVISESTSTPKPSELATGISMALVTTLVGLVIAIPALLVFNIQKNRVGRFMFETGLFAENLITQFSKLVKR